MKKFYKNIIINYSNLTQVGLGLVRSQLIKGSFFMVIGTNFANFLAYIYHLIFGRIMGPSLYGDLVIILSLIALFSSVFSFVGTVLVKLVSSKEGNLNALHFWILKKVMIVGALIVLVFILYSGFFSDYLRVDSITVFLVSLIIFFSLLSFIYNSFMQGFLMFKQAVIVNNVTWIARIGLGSLLFFMGYSIGGLSLSLVIAAALSIVLSYYFLRRKLKFNLNSSSRPIVNKFLKYSLPAFILTLSTGSLFTSDLLIIKNFFEPKEVGFYAALSTLGKIIFYAVAPVVSVMFPLAARKNSENQKPQKILRLTLLLSGLFIAPILLIYTLWPGLIVSLLFGELYLEIAPYLIYFGIFSSIFTINVVLSNFYFSIGKTFSSGIVFVFALIQIVAIILFGRNIQTVVLLSIFTSIALLLTLTIFGVKVLEKKR